jgi:ubiquinol-cytochrome c reductase cytochrome c1 subunit
VYTEVFAPCHPLSKFTFNHLQSFMTKEEIKKLASNYDILDENPADDGTPVIRKGKPTDYLPSPYPNQKAARFANGGAEPPDLRTIVFGREEGPDYVFALLTGYHWNGDIFPVPSWVPERKAGQFFNPYFKGGVLAMPPPLSDGMLDYEDGTPATTSQMAKDVVNFLRWAAEPEYDERRLWFWKCATTCSIMLVMLAHQAQKNTAWKTFSRVRFRYWNKAAWGGPDLR